VSLAHIVLLAAAFLAGAQNALAGGGSFLTFPALLYAGLDPRAANIASAIALFPGQITTSFAGRKMVTGAAGLRVTTLVWISLVGGGLGAFLLLATPVTVVFGWGSFFTKPRAADAPPRISPRSAAIAQFAIAIYGGYFGGGIGILMLAALTAAGLAVRHAGATKNLLAGVMNISAVLIFVWRTHVAWGAVIFVAVAAVAGGQLGVFMLRRINETVLRVGITAIGVALTIGLFIRG
jgi:uncharacterized membrane protein YfcA